MEWWQIKPNSEPSTPNRANPVLPFVSTRNRILNKTKASSILIEALEPVLQLDPDLSPGARRQPFGGIDVALFGEALAALAVDFRNALGSPGG